MPINNFSIGHDVAVDVTNPLTGKLMTLDSVTGFNAEQQTKEITSEPLNGPPQFAHAPNGWKGAVDFDRQSANADIFISQLEANYWAGINTLSGTITETITNPDQSISQFKFTGCTFKYGDAGKWKAQEKVPIRLDWTASQRVQIV